ncbi:MAG: peptidoglycan bridge formation glycyltransferase FemA/FemB family protein [Patescibacteria group bacterium]|jgi:lipid II:glycine glycyltransferase (peptidoglycan interpeptide bridge formation enzyme)
MKIIDLKKEKFSELLKNDSGLEKSKSSFLKYNFLQSYQWAEIQENFGQKVWFKALEDKDKIIALFLTIEKKLFLNKKYWYIPRGPIFIDDDKNFNWSDFLKTLKKTAGKSGILFIRLEPQGESFKLYLDRNKRALVKTKDIQPAKTSVLDLSLGEEDLLKKMSQKTRYNIKLGSKKGVEIMEGDDSALEDFWKLIAMTARRDKFFIHSKNYYSNLINYKGNFIKVFLARADNKILAGGIFSFSGNTVSYLHGASSNDDRNFMAPYVLHWEAIKRAKKEGFRYYDFYGVDDKKWPGVSRFKRGFGGEDFELPGTFDLVVKKFGYYFYFLFRFFRKFLKFL